MSNASRRLTGANRTRQNMDQAWDVSVNGEEGKVESIRDRTGDTTALVVVVLDSVKPGQRSQCLIDIEVYHGWCSDTPCTLLFMHGQ